MAEFNYGNNSFDRNESSFRTNTEKQTSEPVEIDFYGKRTSSEKKHKKSKAGIIALIVTGCILLSSLMGFGGAYVALRLIDAGGADVPAAQSGGELLPAQSTASSDAKDFGTYTEVASICSPSVVAITTEAMSNSGFLGQYITSGAGSGVIITSDGKIITNYHVVSGATSITATLSNGTEYPATLIAGDKDGDIAVLKIEATGLTAAAIGNSDNLVVGEEIIAIGNPLGKLSGTVTNGIISALSREISIDGESMTLLQTNTAINPGNSGGGLFNMKGQLVGIVNAKSSGTVSGSSIEGIGFAIPINMAYSTALDLLEYGYVRGRASLGISTLEINDYITAMYYRVNNYGVYVYETGNTELKMGDRIVALGGTEVTSEAEIKKILSTVVVGDTVTVTVIRDGQTLDVSVVTVEKQATGTGVKFDTSAS